MDYPQIDDERTDDSDRDRAAGTGDHPTETHPGNYPPFRAITVRGQRVSRGRRHEGPYPREPRLRGDGPRVRHRCRSGRTSPRDSSSHLPARQGGIGAGAGRDRVGLGLPETLRTVPRTGEHDRDRGVLRVGADGGAGVAARVDGRWLLCPAGVVHRALGARGRWHDRPEKAVRVAVLVPVGGEEARTAAQTGRRPSTTGKRPIICTNHAQTSGRGRTLRKGRTLRNGRGRNLPLVPPHPHRGRDEDRTAPRSERPSSPRAGLAAAAPGAGRDPAAESPRWIIRWQLEQSGTTSDS
jgi:hypothetical protein